MYFLEIYWFRGSATCLELKGVPKSKSVKNGSFKTRIFCIKSTLLKNLGGVPKILCYILILRIKLP